ncbi:hypothetical protein FALBO_16067 [Fusarium albosuccineum]|uniref:Uncharacterized protein n=1 Tax=Fusarium albosuccineum TaxID=1237068 RepID=A0A8H4KNE9_9HYPO|nr:hypothetical protein FALBO_16067 [Fusarium albosuccineum]
MATNPTQNLEENIHLNLELSQATEQEPEPETIPWMIAKWCNEAGLHLVDARAYGGDWEKWAQIELLLFLSQEQAVPINLFPPCLQGYTFDRQRSDKLPDKDWIVDLWLESPSPSQNQPNYAVELKCRQVYDQASPMFRAQFKLAINKCSKGSPVPNTKTFAVAITHDINDCNYWAGFRNVFYHQEPLTRVFVIWRET